MTDTRDVQRLFYGCMPIFTALGDEVRLAIIEALAGTGPCGWEGPQDQPGQAGPGGKRGLNVKEITEKTSLSRPAISHHLKILKEAGLVCAQKAGTSNYYYLTIANGAKMLHDLSLQLQQLL